MKSLHDDQERAARAMAQSAIDAQDAQDAQDAPPESVVGEGPAVSSNWTLDKDIPFGQLPFAYRLNRFLVTHGGVVGFEQGQFRHGDIAVDVEQVIRAYTQFHVTADCPEALGEMILAKVGKLVTFGELVCPHGQECVSWSRAGGVFVRHVVVYLIGTDQLGQRWDVLVRKTQ